MESDDLDRRIARTVQARAAATPAPPDFGRVHDRVTARRRRRTLATSIAAAAIVVAGATAWVVRDDPSPAPRVHVPPEDTTASSDRGPCGTAVTPPTEELDLATAAWRDLPPAPRVGRVQAMHVWTGREVIAFGGKLVPPGASDGAPTPSGDAYDPATRTWRSIPDAPFTPREALAATWTGTEMIVVSGSATVPGYGFNLAAAYDPERHTWRSLPDAPVGDVDPTVVWTGNAVLVWGTPDGGAAYEPCTNRWRSIAPMPEGGPLGSTYGFASVWTGTEMVVWAGSNSSNAASREAAAYDPRTDSWRVLPVSPRRPMFGPHAVWTGSEMLAWGWSNVAPLGQRADFGVAFDPTTSTWRELPDAPLGAPQSSNAPNPQFVWTGRNGIAWDGGLDGAGPTVMAYDPSTNAWTRLAAPPVPFATGLVWAGDRLLAFTGDAAFELGAG